jgi:general secretion pathway protein G
MAKNETGFSIIELVVVIGIIAILAGIVTPMVSNLLDDARLSKATSEVKVLAEAITNLYKDTTVWPQQLPINTLALWDDARNGLLSRGTAFPQRLWRGPYVSKRADYDPWGTPYIYRRALVGGVMVNGVMSCGPNKADNASLTTTPEQSRGDDIAYFIH